MKVILSLTSSALWQNLYPNINAINVESLDSIKSMTEGLILVEPSQDICEGVTLDLLARSEKIIIFYQQAEYWIGDAISQGKQVSDSLQQWRAKIDSLLDIKKKNRRKIKLINLDQILFQPEFEIMLGGIIGTEVRGGKSAIEINPYHLLLAKQAVQQADLTTLNTFLFASSELVGKAPAMMFDIQNLVIKENATLSKIRSGQEQSTLFSKELVVAHDEVYSLNEIILELSKRIEDSNKERIIDIKSKDEIVRAHEEVLIQKQSAYEVLQIEKQSLLNELDSRAECEERISVLDLTNKELTVKTSSLKKSLLQEQDSIKQKNEELHNFSQKNKKLRLEIMGFKESYNNKVEENLQLSESLTIQNESLKETIGKQTQQIHELMEKKKIIQSETIISQKKLQRELKKSQSELNLFKATSAAYVQKINSLELEMTTIKKSVMWKTTAPIRALSNVISKKDRDKQSLQQDMALIMSSKYFDMKWYLKTYPDVAVANINPAEHYLKFGAKEGRYCGPTFDAIWYLNKYSDVAESGMNPLLHFIKYGEPEGRQASPKLLELNAKK